MTVIVYLSLCCFLFLVFLYLVWKLYSFSIILLDVEDALEESLDILDERYKNINKILKKPVFFDSVEIRQVIEEIRLSHEAILTIANKLTKNIGKESEQRIEKNEESIGKE